MNKSFSFLMQAPSWPLHHTVESWRLVCTWSEGPQTLSVLANICFSLTLYMWCTKRCTSLSKQNNDCLQLWNFFWSNSLLLKQRSSCLWLTTTDEREGKQRGKRRIMLKTKFSFIFLPFCLIPSLYSLLCGLWKTKNKTKKTNKNTQWNKTQTQ